MRSAVTSERRNMNAIVAVDRNWAIGNKGDLLVSIPADHRMFRQKTMDSVIIYGRKTLEPFPMGQPLDRRENIILSANPDYKVKNALVVHSTGELSAFLEEGKKDGKFTDDDIFVIGGESVYRQLLPWCDTVFVTKIDYAYEADAYYPNLDLDPEWEMTQESEEQTYFDLEFRFLKYERVPERQRPLDIKRGGETK